METGNRNRSARTWLQKKRKKTRKKKAHPLIEELSGSTVAVGWIWYVNICQPYCQPLLVQAHPAHQSTKARRQVEEAR